MSGPNLEPWTLRVNVTNGLRNSQNIGRRVGPCPGNRRRWVSGSVHAFSQAAHAANTYRPRFQVRTRPSYGQATEAALNAQVDLYTRLLFPILYMG